MLMWLNFEWKDFKNTNKCVFQWTYSEKFVLKRPNNVLFMSQDPGWSSVCFPLGPVCPIYCAPYGRRDSKYQIIPWNSINFHPSALFSFCGWVLWPRIKVWDQVKACSLSQPSQAACWRRPEWPVEAPTPRKDQLRQQPGPLERWKDNSPSHLHWTSCSVKPFVSSDRARLGRKDMSGKLQKLLMFLWLWKDLYNTFTFDGLSHVGPGQPLFVDMFK